ncbi:hypothetical protein [Limimaricola cinnabarinus]|uniref:hypothetical protein n=1 Tax=Limimaricola cinnabarinus TaxID=1125964 RepID=UPI00248F9295|nr:hypothetical protein [Limimaricola cinnabarinus]
MRRLRNRGPGPLTMLALVGGAVWLMRRYRHDMRQAVQAGMGQAPAQPRSGAAFAHDDGPVRQAGREEMRDPPRRWDLQDETVDESFPASDPPSNY